MPNPTSSQLHISGLEVVRQGKHVISGFNGTFSPGVYYVLGKNGVGKSSLLFAIAGLIHYQGDISYQDKNLAQFSPNSRAQVVGLLAQQQLPTLQLTVLAYIKLGRFPYLGWLGRYEAGVDDRVNHQLERLNIQHLVDRPIQELSGGEWQKVRIAQLLVQDTEIALFDEPTQALDPYNLREMHHLIQSLASNGKIVICATHDWEVVKDAKANIIALKNGRLAYSGPPPKDRALFMNQLYEPDAHTKLG